MAVFSTDFVFGNFILPNLEAILFWVELDSFDESPENVLIVKKKHLLGCRLRNLMLTCARNARNLSRLEGFGVIFFQHQNTLKNTFLIMRFYYPKEN